jgi:hypothetical protein
LAEAEKYVGLLNVIRYTSSQRLLSPPRFFTAENSPRSVESSKISPFFNVRLKISFVWLINGAIASKLDFKEVLGRLRL